MTGEGPGRGPIPLEEVAAIVRNWPTTTGYGPYIAGRWQVPLATARRWIYQARLAGLLDAGTNDRPCRACDGSGTARWHNPAGREAKEES